MPTLTLKIDTEKPAFWYAIKNRYNPKPKVIKKIIAAGADVNAKDKYNNTAWSYSFFNKDIQKILVDAGAANWN